MTDQQPQAQPGTQQPQAQPGTQQPQAQPGTQQPQAQPQAQPGTQQPQAQSGTQQPQAQPQAYQSIIEQQNAQIAALIAQNQALNGQITQMVQGGAQFTQQPQAQPGTQQQFANAYGAINNPAIMQPSPMQAFNPPSLADNQDWSLEALGKEIGKKPTQV